MIEYILLRMQALFRLSITSLLPGLVLTPYTKVKEIAL